MNLPVRMSIASLVGTMLGGCDRLDTLAVMIVRTAKRSSSIASLSEAEIG
jgi:hypothetical protein